MAVDAIDGGIGRVAGTYIFHSLDLDPTSNKQVLWYDAISYTTVVRLLELSNAAAPAPTQRTYPPASQ